ncbi:MAG: carbonic anhydrase [Woeseiaceae bacterium]|nr:carbonic anhydrase [Woeseiaceae bacterium]
MLDPIQALERLKVGNERFVSNASTLDITSARRRELSKGQAPYAIVLGCADSRVPTEVVFDQGLGELFVIRVAGNIVQPSQIGSVEFATQHFGTRLVVVLGHTGCDAIAATIDELRRSEGDQSANMAAIVSRIRPAVEGLIDQIDDPVELEHHAVRENVRYQAEALRHGSTIVEYLVDRGDLIIVGAEYDLETGVVDFFDGMPE